MQIKINRWLGERGLKNVADNKTVAEIVKQVRRECNSLPLPNAAGEKLKLVREINDAHKRELAAKDEEIKTLRAALKPILEFRTDTKDWWSQEKQRESAYKAIRAAQRIYKKEVRDGE